MPEIYQDNRNFTAARAWGARDFAEIEGATVRLHWTDQPYHWHVNDGPEVFVVLDGVVVSAPRFNEPIIGGQAQIEGDFTAQEAQDLAAFYLQRHAVHGLQLAE